MTKTRATFRFIGSLIWLAGMCYLFWLLSMVPKGGWHDNPTIVRMGERIVAIIMFGIPGLFQSAAFVKIFFFFQNMESNTKYYDVYTDSSGFEVGRSVSGEGKLLGCLLSFLLGLFLMLATSIVASPFVFCYNLYNFIAAWTRDTFLSALFKFIAILLICAFLVVTYLSGRWMFEQLQVVREYYVQGRANAR